MTAGGLRSGRRAAAAALGLALLAGCAAPQSAALRAAAPRPVPRAALIPGVPFFAQDDYHCGPAALAIAMSAAGRPTEPAELVARVFLPARSGSLQAEVLAAPRAAGLLSTRLPGTLEALLAEVASDTPVVIFQNLSLPASPLWHYAVLIGYDLDAGEAVLHSGRDAATRMPLTVLERTWVRAGAWAIAVTRPPRIPATAAEAEVGRAAVALERGDAPAALAAYGAMLERWPRSRVALLGRANLVRAGGNGERAIGLYREAVELDPGFADAWNNLADALIDARRYDEAASAVAKAIELGGPRLGLYEATRARLPR